MCSLQSQPGFATDSTLIHLVVGREKKEKHARSNRRDQLCPFGFVSPSVFPPLFKHVYAYVCATKSYVTHLCQCIGISLKKVRGHAGCASDGVTLSHVQFVQAYRQLQKGFHREVHEEQKKSMRLIPRLKTAREPRNTKAM